jgi:uncharacterized protein YpmB
MKRKLIKNFLLILLILFIILMTSFFIYIYAIINPIKNIDVSLNNIADRESEFYDINGNKSSIENN